MSEAIRFGIGKMELGEVGGSTGLQFGELQDATITVTGDLKDLWGDDKRFPVEGKHGHRAIEIKAKHARIGASSVNKILGGTISGATATVNALNEIGYFRLVLYNPSDGSDIKVTFPKVKSTADLELSLVQDDFVIPEPSFHAYYDTTGDIMKVEFDS